MGNFVPDDKPHLTANNLMVPSSYEGLDCRNLVYSVAEMFGWDKPFEVK